MPPADRRQGAELRRGLVGALLLSVALWRPAEPAPAPAPAPAPHDPSDDALVSNPSEPTARPTAPDPRNDVLWGGCEEVELSPEGEPIACTLYSDVARDRAILRLWLPSSVQRPVVSIDDAVVTELEATRVHGGWSLHLVPDRSGHLRVSGLVADVSHEILSLDIDLRPRPDADLHAQLDAVVGKPREQRALAKRLRAALAGELPPPQRLMTTQHLQYVSFDMGEHRDAVEHAIEAVRLANAQGKPLAECDSLWAASFVLGESLGDEQAAVERLHSGCPYRARIPFVEMRGAYFEGLRELRQGRLYDAQRSFQRSVQIARRLRWARRELGVLNSLIETLARQGRFGWARQSLERVHELDAPGHHTGLLDRCEVQSRYHRKLGNLALREAELLGDSLALAREHWLHAQEVLRDRTRCPKHPSVRDQGERIAVDLARAAVDAGELERAQAILDQLPRETVATSTDAVRRLGRAELAIARGEPTVAARVLEDLVADRRRGRLAQAMGPEEDWRLHLAWARVHQHRGELSAALEALAAAQGHIDRSRGPSGVETDRPAAMRRESSELLVRLLLDHGLERQALCTARVARARGLAALDPLPNPLPTGTRESLHALERARAELFEGYKWYDPRDIPIDRRLKLDAQRRSLELSLPEPPAPIECDQLPAAVPGEASLLYFHDREGFIGFAWNAEGHVVVQRLSQWPRGRPPRSLGDALIAPFARVLEGATRLRVLAPAAMSEVSFADLPWRGHPLGDRMAVVYALDLPTVPTNVWHEGTAALVLSDPNRALMGRDDILDERFDQWRANLEARSLRVTFETRSSIGSVAEVLQGTRGVDLALLYGFGAVAPSYYEPLPTGAERRDPDQSGFGVGADVLTRPDILLEAGMVPRQVILAHCDSAVVDTYGVSGAIGLAQSYVQAGAEWALGTIGAIPPELMEAVVGAFLEALPHGASLDEVSMAVRLAKQKLRDQGMADIVQLRLWVP